MITPARCAVCGNQVGRDRHGKMLMHTRIVVGDEFGAKPKAEICAGSDRGARP